MPAKRPPDAHWSVVNTQMSALTPSAAKILVAYCVLALGLLLGPRTAASDVDSLGEGRGAEGCLEMMWPPDGYEVKQDELEDFTALLRVNCHRVSPALYVEWSEGVDPEVSGEDGEADKKNGGFGMRIPVQEPTEGEEPEELLEISVFLKRGSKMWRWRVTRKDGSRTTKEYHVLILPLFSPNISVAFPPPHFEFRAAVRPFFIASLHEVHDKIAKFGYPRFFYDITVRSRQTSTTERYEKSFRWGRETQRERHLISAQEKLLPTENMIFMDFIDDAPDGAYELEIARTAHKSSIQWPFILYAQWPCILYIRGH